MLTLNLKILESSEITYEIYSPTSVLALFNNALRLPGTENLIHLRGRYAFGGGKAYTNYFYDTLYSEADSISITVKIPALLRSKIVNNEIYTLKGYIEKILRNSRIDINFVVDGIIAQEEGTFSEDDLKKFELIQKKLEIGSKDLESLIRTKLLNNEIVRVANIYGHSAIVQKDFSEGLDVSQKYFEIVEYTCNITSPTSILTQLSELLNLNYDVIALVRGGGDKQSFEVFNDTTLAEYFINLNSVSVTAIGHTVNESLLDKLADRRFHLPHDYGAGLHLIVDKLVQEKSNSRALLIDEVKKDITKQFTEQVNTLGSQLKKKNEEFVEAQKTYKEQVENQTKSFNDQLKARNEEVEKLKKDLSEKHGEQVKSVQEQLNKKNDEFKKLQEENSKTITQLNENSQKLLKEQLEAMQKSKDEFSALYDRNLKSTVQSETASLAAKIDLTSKENTRLQLELDKKKSNILVYFIILIIGLVLGYFLNK